MRLNHIHPFKQRAEYEKDQRCCTVESYRLERPQSLSILYVFIEKLRDIGCLAGGEIVLSSTDRIVINGRQVRDLYLLPRRRSAHSHPRFFSRYFIATEEVLNILASCSKSVMPRVRIMPLTTAAGISSSAA